MKNLFIFLSVFLAFTACKKTSPVPSNPLPDMMRHSLFYKVVATIPSPADSVRGFFSDSIVLDATKHNTDETYLGNFPFVASNIPQYSTGFSVGYDDPNNTFPYFSFTASAFPEVPRHFEINKPYEAYTTPNTPIQYQRPLFLGLHTGQDGWQRYFVDNVYPDDAGITTSRTYTKVIFSKRQEFPVSPVDTTLLGDGIITGYTIEYYNPLDTGKYVHRLDFTVRFVGLEIKK